MKDHTGRPSHLKVLFRGMGGGFPSSNAMSNTSRYMKGGRACHAEGDMVNPVTGQKAPNIETKTIERARGGGTRHAEGDKVVGTPMRKGGKKRHRRADGGMEAMHVMAPHYGKEAMRKGGKRRRHHAEGGGEEAYERLEKMRGGGHKKKA